MNRIFKIKSKIGEVLGWDIKDFELIKSGKKGGISGRQDRQHYVWH